MNGRPKRLATGSEDETSQFDSDNMRCAVGARQCGKSIDRRFEGIRVSEDGCDVLEQNAWLWKIRDVSDQLFDVLHTYLNAPEGNQWIDSFAPHTKFQVQMRTGTPTGLTCDGRTCVRCRLRQPGSGGYGHIR